MSDLTVQEPLRDRVGRAIRGDEPGYVDWYNLSEEKREPWRQDADRALAVITAEPFYCDIREIIEVLQSVIDCGLHPHLDEVRALLARVNGAA